MDKHEYKLCADEIKLLIKKKKYNEAMEVADTMDWNNVKNVNLLCTVSDLYKLGRRLVEARDIMLMAYEIHPGDKMIVYSLCELSIKLGDVVQAVEFYKEFVMAAPNDHRCFILQYRLYEAQGVTEEEMIQVLENLKARERREKWIYELAYLYHKIGLSTKCVEECDDLFLWFGRGKYVRKALELKMLHEPLTAEQQASYDGIKKVSSTALKGKKRKANKTLPDRTNNFDSIDIGEAMSAAMEDDQDMLVQPVNVGKFATINLQRELAEQIQEVMSTDEDYDVDSDPDNGNYPENDSVSSDKAGRKSRRKRNNPKPAYNKDVAVESRPEADDDEALYQTGPIRKKPAIEEWNTNSDIPLFRGENVPKPLTETEILRKFEKENEDSESVSRYEGYQNSGRIPNLDISEINLPLDETEAGFGEDINNQAYNNTASEKVQTENSGEETGYSNEGGQLENKDEELKDKQTADEVSERDYKAAYGIRDNQSEAVVPQAGEYTSEIVSRIMDDEDQSVNAADSSGSEFDTKVMDNIPRSSSIREITLDGVRPVVTDPKVVQMHTSDIPKVVLGSRTNQPQHKQISSDSPKVLQNTRSYTENQVDRNIPKLVKNENSSIEYEKDKASENQEAQYKNPAIRTSYTASDSAKRGVEKPITSAESMSREGDREYDRLLSQESNGQIKMNMESQPAVVKQLTGQISITDTLLAWEEKKRESRKRQDEEMRQRIKRRTGEIFEGFDRAARQDILNELGAMAEESIQRELGKKPVSIIDAEGNHKSIEHDASRVKKNISSETSVLMDRARSVMSGQAPMDGHPVSKVRMDDRRAPSQTQGVDLSMTAHASDGSIHPDYAPVQTGENNNASAVGRVITPAQAQEVMTQGEVYGSDGTSYYAENGQDAGYDQVQSNQYYGDYYQNNDVNGEYSGQYTNGYDPQAYNEEGYGQGTYTQENYNQEAYSQEGYGQGVYSQEGYGQGTYSQEGYDQGVYSQEGYDQGVYSQEGYDQGAYSQESYGQGTYSQEGYDQGVYSQEGYDQGIYSQEGYDQGIYSQEGYGQENQVQYQAENQADEYSEKTANLGQYADEFVRAEEDNASFSSKEEGRENETSYENNHSRREKSGLTSEEKKLFGSFIQTKSTLGQIIDALENVSLLSHTGNLIITGAPDMGAMDLARNLVKSTQKNNPDFSKKMAKISGDALNKKSIDKTIRQLKNGALIIEHAADMDAGSIEELLQFLNRDGMGIIVVLVDTKINMNKLIDAHEELNGPFNLRVDIEALDNNSLVNFAKKYATDREYSIDEMGLLALHTRISNLQTSDHTVTTRDVKEIVDEAISKADKTNITHFMDFVMGKRYDDDDMVILREKDFV